MSSFSVITTYSSNPKKILATNTRFFNYLKNLKIEKLLALVNSIESYISKDLLNCIKEDISYIFDSFVKQILSEYNIKLIKSDYHESWLFQKEEAIHNLFNILYDFIKNLKEVGFTSSKEEIYEYIINFSKTNNLRFINFSNYLKKEFYDKQIDSYYNRIKNEIEAEIDYKDIEDKSKKDDNISKNFEKLSVKAVNWLKKIEILNNSFNTLDFINISLKEIIQTKLQKLNKYKEELMSKINSKSNDLELFYKNIEFNYLEIKKLIKINIFHLELNSKLNELKNLLEIQKNLEKDIIDKVNNLINEINFLIKSDSINENVIEDFDNRYNLIVDEIQKFIYKEREKQEIMDNLIKSLSDLGYSALITTSDGIIFFDSPLGIEYKIMLKMFKDKVAVKFVKIIEDNYVLSDTEKERDIELVKDWCKDYQKVLDYLKENNIYLETERIINPEDDPNLIYTNFSRLPIEIKELYSKQIENKKRFINKDKKQKQDYYQI